MSLLLFEEFLQFCSVSLSGIVGYDCDERQQGRVISGLRAIVLDGVRRRSGTHDSGSQYT